MKLGEVLTALGRPVAFYPKLALALGDVKAAILLCQLLYWRGKGSGAEEVYKTAGELTAETGLSYKEQRGARKVLRGLGVLSERLDRIGHRTFYLVDLDVLDELWERWISAGEPSRRPQSAVANTRPRVPKGRPEAGRFTKTAGGGTTPERCSGTPRRGAREHPREVPEDIEYTESTQRSPPLPPPPGGCGLAPLDHVSPGFHPSE